MLPIGGFPYGIKAGDAQLRRTNDGCSEKQDIGCRSVPALGQVITSFYVSLSVL